MAIPTPVEYARILRNLVSISIVFTFCPIESAAAGDRTTTVSEDASGATTASLNVNRLQASLQLERDQLER